MFEIEKMLEPFIQKGFSQNAARFCRLYLLCWCPEELDRLLDFGLISGDDYERIIHM